MSEFTGPMTTGGTGTYTVGGVIKLTGFKEIHDALLQLPKEIKNRIMNKAMRAGNEIFLSAIRTRAPKGTGLYKGQKKGHVANAAYISRSKWTGEGVTMGIGMRRDVGFNWHFLEFGTGTWYRGTGKSVRGEYRIPKEKNTSKGPLAFISKSGKMFSKSGMTSSSTSSYKRFLTMGEGEFAKAGTSQYWILHHAHHPGIRPRPFIRPAFDENVQAAIASVKAIAGSEIEKDFLKRTKKAA